MEEQMLAARSAAARRLTSQTTQPTASPGRWPRATLAPSRRTSTRPASSGDGDNEYQCSTGRNGRGYTQAAKQFVHVPPEFTVVAAHREPVRQRAQGRVQCAPACPPHRYSGAELAALGRGPGAPLAAAPEWPTGPVLHRPPTRDQGHPDSRVTLAG